MNRHFLNKILYNTSIRTKMLLVYSFLILLPLGIFMLISHAKVSDVLEEQTLLQANQVFSEMSERMASRFQNGQTSVDVITYDPYIYTMSSQINTDYSFVDQLNTSNLILSNLSRIRNSTLVDDINLFIWQDFLFSTENVDIFHADRIIETYWYKDLLETERDTRWYHPKQLEDNIHHDMPSYSIIRRFFDIGDMSQTAGYVEVLIYAENIDALLQEGLMTEHTFNYITDGNTIIQSTDPSRNALFTDYNTSLLLSSSGLWNEASIGADNYYTYHQPIENTPYTLVLILPYDDVFTNSDSLLLFMAVVLVIVAIIAYIIAILVSRSSVKRLFVITKAIEEVKNGNLKVHIATEGSDEISDISNHFNEMVQRTDELIEEKYTLGKELKNQELKALQAQINPHFLYNSLNVINYIAMKHKIHDIVAMVNSLSKFYKLSLSKGKDLIKLQDELEHVKMYVNIMNMRFKNRIEFTYDVEPLLLNQPVIKIILQPIIENAIIHGIFEKDSKAGKVHIEGCVVDHQLTLRITDDGIGITEPILQTILIDTESSSGYGIKNVNYRIMNYYGNNYGLNYESEVGVGTTVTVTLPMDNIL